MTSSKGTLYLTFDDGPDPISTERVLEVLEREQALSTFFVVATKAQKQRALLEKILSGGHSVGNHSLDHHYSSFFASQQTMNDWVWESERVFSELLVEPVGFRPPAGVVTPPLRRALKAKDLSLVLWNTRFFDTVFPWTMKRAESSLLDAKDGDVILLHDRQPKARVGAFCDTLTHYIKTARAHGFTFDKLTREIAKALTILLVFIAGLSNASAQTATQVDEDRNAIRLSAHRPLYFLYGDPSGKVQLSAKEQVFAGPSLYVGYTQLMLWDFATESTPFNDVNFNPEFFYRFQLSDSQTLDLGFYEHSSNGKGGPESRSINSSYLSYAQKFQFGNWSVEPGIKVATFYALDSFNKNYRDYLGSWIGTLRLEVNDFIVPSAELNFELRPGGAWGNHFDRGYQQFEVALRLDRTDFLPYLYVQYFNGYGESLITFDSWSSHLRIGLRK